MKRLQALVALALLAACQTSARVESVAPPVQWEDWSPAVFERARAEDRLVLLDLAAVWCHWCHVMEETTYRDPEVSRLLALHFVCVRVDQDARPDLSNRYEDYGWPATVIFDARGGELVKRAGYVPPAPMRAFLAAVVADPTPGPSVTGVGRDATSSAPSDASELDAELRARFERGYDAEHGGWGTGHKYLDPTNVEYALALALGGDEDAKTKAQQTFDAELALLDPAWGGFYQYSTDGAWTEPHFEKIAWVQAENLRLYSLAYAAWKSPRHAEAARATVRFLRDFLTSPDGAFFTSQDADLVQGEHAAEYFALDDAGRRALGVPRVDGHVYSRENGAFIRALCQTYASLGDEDALAAAVRAANWIVAERSLDGGGFRHDERDVGGPYLGDTLNMGQAFLALYEVTAERAWLERALAASEFLATRFRSDAGFETTAIETTVGLAQAPQRDENVAVARFETRLSRYAGGDAHRERAEHALRWLTTPDVALRFPTAAKLLVESELSGEPLHVTIVGSKSDPAAKALFRAALARAATFRRIEWFDPAEGPLPNPDVEYPSLDRAAAFACAEGRCSAPAFTPFELDRRLARSR
ncbi:MAG: DUF255 domain-containing protein [Planctomycetes bacterium]|nr:DUF255 domain-containing protein [Planctomycetota bacterium]